MEIDEIYSEIDARKDKLEPEINRLNKRVGVYSNWAWGFVFLGFFVAAIGIICFFFPKISGELNLNELGDYLAGSVASVWSLAGLFLIYVAFLGQKQQLIQQQIEILYSQAEVRATRVELKGQKEQLILQNKTLQLQRFENTFFQLLKVYQSIVESFNNEGTGKSYFVELKTKLISSFSSSEMDDFLTKHKKAVSTYEEFYFSNKENLAYYLRSLYRLFRFIQQGDLTLSEKMVYAKIIRAQLSEGELYILYYNSQTDYGQNFKAIIKEFNLLKHLSGFEKMEFALDNSKGFYFATPSDDREKRRKFYNTVFSITTSLLRNNELRKIEYLSPFVIFESKRIDNEYYISIDVGSEYSEDGYLKKGYGGEYMWKRDIINYLKNIIVEILILNQLHLEYSEKDIILENSLEEGETHNNGKILVNFHHRDYLELTIWNDSK